MSNYKIEAGTAQHLGNRPQQNDRAALYTAPRAPGYVMAVLADGMASGSTAPEQVLHTSKQLFDEYRAGDTVNLGRLQELLRSIALETHEVLAMNPLGAAGEPQSTLVLLVLTPQGQAVWASVGDSRLYRMAGTQCAERSGDAAYVEHLVNVDKLPLEAARKHRSARLLANVLGNRQKAPFVTLGVHQGLQPGDAFLLCSDGLWQYFTDTELATVVARATPRQASEMLINKAIERAKGQGDNCSMAIVKLVAPPKETPAYTVQKMGKAV
ncbi:serine/threonine protein phosphatase [Massilia sp. Root418]|uniref:PP2C family protein-serine/threonine phosphatase n=1 Tax=Massilia sp. Root418 TaxID=1736532 RepID=UPI0006F1E05A|nr:protein phosphatase 2C domain-containing protein [Massilia sp. Root418]KQW97204.1 serine/threonine protein phosphatase [Massilia sp. Root418]